MSVINSIWLGKVSSIQDVKVWAITADIFGHPEFGDNGIYSIPLGSVTSRIEVDDPIMLFQLDDRPGSYFYMPLAKSSGNCRLQIKNKDSVIDLTDPDQIIINFQDKSYLVANGDLYVNVSSKIKVNGPGTLSVKGVVTPNNMSYPLNCVPVCTYTGIQHGGYEMNLSDPAEQVPETEPKGDE